MLLVVGALIFRSYNRSTQVIADFQQQKLENAATPAIDRAKAKLEKLFDPEKLPPGIPPEDLLEKNLRNIKFPGENQIKLKINGAEETDGSTAWYFDTDTDGDGQPDARTAYAIVLRSTRGTGNNAVTMDYKTAEDLKLPPGNLLKKDQDKANQLLVRNGPLLTQRDPALKACERVDPNTGEGSIEGWFPKTTALFMKNFQVYAVTVPRNASANKGISTIQYQQDRYYELSNKWGAWFRTDLELFPGPSFDWNGAMHTEGSLFVKANAGKIVKSDLISSKDSCFYDPELNSEVSAANHLVYAVPASGNSNGAFSGSVKFYIHENYTGAEPKSAELKDDKDSVKFTTDVNATAINVALDPRKMLTDTGSNTPRDTKGWEPDDAWKNASEQDNPLKKRIIVGKNECPPYVDDSYRADDRYGPKSGYTKPIKKIEENGKPKCSVELNDKFVYGNDISWNVDPESQENKLIRNEPPSEEQVDDYGLDGYWERRARAKGLRIIVGQRLELGNAFGWKGVGDPLNPPGTKNSTGVVQWPSSNEQRQRRTLRDNLAAVQATAVYHYTEPSTSKGYFPTAVVATTVHPGTEETLKQSATFEMPGTPFKTKTGYPFGGEFGDASSNNEILTDFLTGRGTNGWEFEPPLGNNTAFEAQIKTGNSNLRKALRNLAYFAGDPKGSFPPVQEAGLVHPYPQLTMWGDYSNLRRIIKRLDDGTKKYPNGGTQSEEDLSIADQTTLHTAASTLGMLAYNISYLQAYDYATNTTELTKLKEDLEKLSNGNTTDGEVKIESGNVKVTPPGGTEFTVPGGVAPPDAYIAALPDAKKQLARLIHLKEQVEFDRQHPPVAAAGASTCTDLTALGLVNLCPKQTKYPALYYLFPSDDHTEPDIPANDRIGNRTDDYIKNTANPSATVKYAKLDADAIKAIALKPRKFSDWKLPNVLIDSGSNLNPNNQLEERIVFKGAGVADKRYQVALKDSALYNGREAMSVRVLNLDLNLLRTKKPSSTASENWLPNSGIVYAFREDAVREDAIARPGGTKMTNLNSANPTDPPLILIKNSDPSKGSLSYKSVDYYADPDRRPYGFRLKKGNTLRRSENPNDPTGMTFVSDNPVYVQGHFNVHSSSDTGTINDIDEFQSGSGYTRTNPKNANFANPTVDRWRQTEVIADAISILSNNFCDGSIEEGIVNGGTSEPNIDVGAKYGCNVANTSKRYTSYINQNRPKDALSAPDAWLRENIWENPTPSPKSPIVINIKGEIEKKDGPYAGAYFGFANGQNPDGQNGKKRIVPAETTVNMVLVSGIIPSRADQQNGGFHNFPRFLEEWKDTVKLNIRGSLIQLNFSNYATGPHDQDSWEPTTDPSPSNSSTNFFSPPSRNWGYDVALQLAPAGPVAKRMGKLNTQRDEFYREPKADDPYICMLREASDINYPCK